MAAGSRPSTPLGRWQAVLGCRVTGPAKAVLFAVAARDGTPRGCTASVARLAVDAGVSERSVRRGLRVLVEAGIVEITEAKGRTNRVRVAWHIVAEMSTEPEVGECPQLLESEPTQDESPEEVLQTSTAEAEPESWAPPATQPQFFAGGNSEPQASSDPRDPACYGKGVKASDVSMELWSVFDHWRQRQPTPKLVKLTKGRVRLLARALADYEAGDVIHLIVFAYEAPVGSRGLPDRFAKPWRVNCQGRPDLEMLLRRDGAVDKLARNIEMSNRWNHPADAPGRSESPTIDPDQAWTVVMGLTRGGHLLDAIKRGALADSADEHAIILGAIKAAGGYPAFRAIDQYTEGKVRETFLSTMRGHI